MAGTRIYKAVLGRLRRFIKEFFAEVSLTPADVDLVVPHQPSEPALRSLSRLGFDQDKIVNIVGQYGNCVAASMPMALSIAAREGRIQSGDRVLLLGTAAGVSIGAALLEW